MALIEGEGTSESAWHPWLDALGPPRREVAGLMGAERRLVVLAPHPDDEVLACGGLIGMHLAQGGESIVVALTDGEGADPQRGAADREALAVQRSAEREAGLRRLGFEQPDIVPLGLPDGHVAQHIETAARALDRLLRPGDLLVTTWRHDGHPDHEAAGRCAAQVAAVKRVRLIEAPVWMWHWAQPGDPRVPWHRLVALPLTQAMRESKRAALDRHRSQFGPRADDAQAVLIRGLIARTARADEHYIV